MKSLFSFMKKEYLEAARTGKVMMIILLFVLFGIMSPAVAKLTPWMMETLSDSMAESGFIVTNVQVDALTSWTQFFKNIPIALIAFVLIFSDIFTNRFGYDADYCHYRQCFVCSLLLFWITILKAEGGYHLYHDFLPFLFFYVERNQRNEFIRS